MKRVNKIIMLLSMVAILSAYNLAQADSFSELVDQYYGPSSIYTANRTSNSCDTNSTQVELVADSAALNTILTDNLGLLSGNTIYILESGNFIIDQAIQLNDCTAIIGSGNVTLYSSVSFSDPIFGMIMAATRQNVIIDNITLDGLHDGVGGNHEGSQGIYFSDNTTNSTLYRIQSQNGANIRMTTASFITIDNSQFYNNTYITIDLSTNHVINNVQIFNGGGLNIDSSTNFVINNSQFYNNGGHGISLTSWTLPSAYITLNNVQSYNNSYAGIYVEGVTANIFNNSSFYNNGTNGITSDVSSSNTYYGTLKVFGNGSSQIDDSSTFVAGTDDDYPSVFSVGILSTTGTMYCGWATNPRNQDGILLQSGYQLCNLTGTVNSWMTSSLSNFMYGPNIHHQIQPLQDAGVGESILSDSNLLFDTNKYIAELNLTPYISSYGTLELTPQGGYTQTTSIQALLYSESLTTYELSGDFVGSPITATLSGTTTLDITLTSALGDKLISVTYSTGGQQSTFSQSMRLLSPSEYPIYQYFGANSPYTENRSSNTCDLGAMQIVNITGNDALLSILNANNYALPANTMYMLSEGTYIVERDISLDNCTAVIGDGNVSMYSSLLLSLATSGNFIAAGKAHIILDGLKINGFANGVGSNHGTNAHVIYLNASQDITIHNIQAYDRVSFAGIRAEGSDHITIDDSQTYNSNSRGIQISNSSNCLINNVQSYNNSTNGIYLSNSRNTVINNTQIYNNAQDGISISSSPRNTISNSQIYNNGNNGVYISVSSSKNNIFNNTKLYNNRYYGIRFSSSTGTYYGDLTLFGNGSGNASILPITGSSTDIFNAGSLITAGTMSCDIATNPVNQAGTSLQTGGTCNERGQISSWRTSSLTTSYVYGVDVIKQTHPIKDNGDSISSVFAWSDTPFDSDLFIAQASVVLDTTAPTAGISYSPGSGSKTSGDVIATITLDEAGTITNNSGSTGYTFTGDGTFTFEFEDLAGNTGSATATVNRIDKTKPVGTITYTPTSGSNTSGDVVATITLDETGTITNNSGSTGYTFTGDGTFTFEFRDTAGNTGSKTATVNRIDKTAPTASTIHYNITGTTDQDVIATITGFSETVTGLNVSTHTFTGNGTFVFSFQDLAGNTGSKTATVTWIDKTPPSPGGGNYYPPKETETGLLCSAFSPELNGAYTFAFTNGITTIKDCQQANLTGTLQRSHLAKMISQFAVKVMNMKIDTTKACSFSDIGEETQEIQLYIKIACQLGLMGYDDNGNQSKTFDPFTTVNRAQFGTILSRVLRGTKYNGADPYYLKHLNALKLEGIMTNISQPLVSEIRGRVMLMLQRIEK